MAVISDTFGGLRLSGSDADKFRNQVRFGRTNANARGAATRGVALARALLADGQVTIDTRKG